MLLLHGFGDTPQTLRYLADDLAAHEYGVRVPLLPGHGRSAAVFDKTTHIEWIAAARAELLAMRVLYPWVAVVGLSMGGALSVILAAEFQDIPVLVLLAPYLGMPWYIRATVSWAGVWSDIIGPIHGSSPRSIHDPAERAKNLAYGSATGRTLRELARVMQRAQRALPDVTARTLLIQSREDNRVAPQVAERAFAALGATDKRLLFTQGAGHIITVDYGRDRIFEEIRAWLGGGPGTIPPE
ncbi:MAG TPA: alpha/beta fold hydrolase, partial [Gemmatimonadaceae bacterium]|nr:alpha/beta fold hydrolase [Gemmatimonadaceae bacterium]